MKFSCERCGKRYATAERPAPGRVYKLKCKACGHLIVVRVAAGDPVDPEPRADASEGARPDASPAALAGDAATSPDSLSAGAPEATPSPGAPVAPPAPPSAGAQDEAAPPYLSDARSPLPFFDATTEVTMPQPLQDSGAVTPPPAAAGYVDLFSDLEPEAPEPKRDDPFLAAARASLPDGFTPAAGGPDPFGVAAEPPSERTPARAVHAPLPTPKVPVIPKPPQQRSTLPLVMMGVGVLLLVGILAFVMLSTGTRAPVAEAPRAQTAPRPPPVAAPPPPAARAAATPPPVAPPPPPVAPAPVPVPEVKAVAEAKPPPDPKPVVERKPVDPKALAEAQRRREREEAAREEKARLQREAREREDAARAEKVRLQREARERAASEARERDRLAREQKAAQEREARERAARERQERERLTAAASSQQAPQALTPAQVEGVLVATKPSFDACLKASDVKLDGRRVMLRLNIQSSGTVTYPTLDDVTLNGTTLGACLKSAARLMVFPKFAGDTMHIEVPLALRR